MAMRLHELSERRRWLRNIGLEYVEPKDIAESDSVFISWLWWGFNEKTNSVGLAMANAAGSGNTEIMNLCRAWNTELAAEAANRGTRPRNLCDFD